MTAGTIEAVLLDRFGVLQTDGLHQTYRLFGGDPTAESAFIADTIAAAHTGLGSSVAQVFARRFGVPERQWVETCQRESWVNTQLVALARRLIRAGKKVGVLSNASAGSRLPDCLEGIFDPVVISGDVGLAKPDTRAYEYAAHQMGVPPGACLMVDDTSTFVAGARQAGMAALRYQTTEALEGELLALGL